MYNAECTECSERERERVKLPPEGSEAHRLRKQAWYLPCLLFINDGTDIMQKREYIPRLQAWANNTQLIGFHAET